MNSKSQKNLQKNKTNIREKEQHLDIINKKARNYARGLKWGKGSTNKVKEILLEALDKPCHWCGQKLTLDNIQLDHKKPMLRTLVFTAGEFIRQTPPAKEFIRLNRLQNLRFICQRCNLTKGTLPENEFEKLNNFLKKNKRLRYYIKAALYYYNTRYSNFIGLFKG